MHQFKQGLIAEKYLYNMISGRHKFEEAAGREPSGLTELGGKEYVSIGFIAKS